MNIDICEAIKTGENYFLDGNYVEARKWFKKAEKIDPSHVEVLNNLGVVAFQSGDLDSSVKYFSKSFRIDSQNLDTAQNLGKCYHSKMEFYEAIKWYKKALNLDDKNWDILNHIADCFVNMENYEKAIDACHKSLRINPDQEDIIALEKQYNAEKKNRTNAETSQNTVFASPLDKETIVSQFQEILNYIVIGKYPQAIDKIIKYFSKEIEPLEYLNSLGVFNFSGNIPFVFAHAFLKIGNINNTEIFINLAKGAYDNGIDTLSLLECDSYLRKNDFETLNKLASEISAEKPVIKEVRQLLSDAATVKQEKANHEYIMRMHKNNNFNQDVFFVLGLKAIGHDAHATFLDEAGDVVFDAEEERYVRKKHSPNRPLNAIISGMKKNGIHPAQVKYIAFSFSAPEYIDAQKKWEDYYRSNGHSTDRLQMVHISGNYAELLMQQENYQKELFPNAEVIHVKHHFAHCAGAFYSSPFERAAILSVDGRGEFETVMLARGEGDNIEELETILSPHSLGSLYQCITHWLGLSARNEGKTMGLSSYGDPNVYYNIFRKYIVDYDEQTGFFQINRDIINPDGDLLYDYTKFNDIFDIHMKMDNKNPQSEFANVAASLQRITEEIIMKLVGHLKKISGEEYLCMTGGVALNSVANGLVLKSNIFKDVSMHPAAHDGGTGLGAALYVYYNNVKDHRVRKKTWWQMKHPYLGNEYSDEDITEAIKSVGFPVRKTENAPAFAANKLSEGKIVGWYQGRMEVGPRALGNRSILGHPGIPGMKDEINRRVKFREWWRPFAPSVLLEDCGIYFDSDHESPYMLFVYNTKEEMLDKIPAVCHVDGTVRVQTVDKTVNPRYYELINEFKKLTGIGLVLNTSMNIRGEPIVCTPKEAVDCFLTGGMDYMVLGDYYVSKDDLPGLALIDEYMKKDSIILNIPTRTGRINGFINVDVPVSGVFNDVNSDLAELKEFESGSVDLIHSHYYFQTLSMKRIHDVFEEWNRVIKKGGDLIVEVPSSEYSLNEDEMKELARRDSLRNKSVGIHQEITKTPLGIRTLKVILKKFGFGNIEQVSESLFHPEKIGSFTLKAEKLEDVF